MDADAGPMDAGGGGASDEGGPGDGGLEADAYTPALVPPFPLVPDRGGPRLAAPVIVPVYFPGDPLRADLDKFNSWIVKSQYLSATTAEYGVGNMTLKPAVDIPTAAPTTIDDTDIAKWIAARVVDKTLPAPTKNTIYLLYYQSSTTITLMGAQSCNDFGGYHNAAAVPGGSLGTGEVAYAVVPRCTWGGYNLELTTNSASHEIIEAATDPLALTDPAWELDTTKGSTLEAWKMLGGPELADLCENQSFHSISGFSVQDSWSNAAMKAHLDPCQPSDPARPFFTVVADKTIYHAQPGSTLDVHAVATSNLPAPAWGLAINSAYTPSSDFDGKATLDKKSVSNGDDVHVTVTIPSNPPMNGGRSVYRFTIDSLESDNSGFYHPWPVLVVVP